MKKKLLLLLPIISVLSSCSNNMFMNQEDETVNLNTKPTTWQEQLEYAKNSLNTRATTDRISLLSYTYVGKIDSESDIPLIMEQLFSDNFFTVLYTDDSNFDIVPMRTIVQTAKEQGLDNPFDDLKSQLKVMIQVGMELIELEWNYKGETYYSTAIASNKKGGIIYDHIGFMIKDKTESVSYEEEFDSNILVVKTRSETNSDDITKVFNENETCRNPYDVILYKYNITCTSVFNNSGTLIDRTLNKYTQAMFPWSCSADIRTISGELDESLFHEFAWGYAYGCMITVSLGWNGNGFSASGGGTSETGTEIHRK